MQHFFSVLSPVSSGRLGPDFFQSLRWSCGSPDVVLSPPLSRLFEGIFLNFFVYAFASAVAYPFVGSPLHACPQSIVSPLGRRAFCPTSFKQSFFDPCFLSFWTELLFIPGSSSKLFFFPPVLRPAVFYVCCFFFLFLTSLCCPPTAVPSTPPGTSLFPSTRVLTLAWRSLSGRGWTPSLRFSFCRLRIRPPSPDLLSRCFFPEHVQCPLISQ